MTRAFQRLRTGCRGKIAFLSEEQTTPTVSTLRKRGDRVHAYECDFCGYWHVGHFSWEREPEGRIHE